jgi:hypothetical protein
VAQANEEVTRGPMRRCHVAPSGRSKWFFDYTKSGDYHQIWWESSKSGKISLNLVESGLFSQERKSRKRVFLACSSTLYTLYRSDRVQHWDSC